MKNKYIYLVRVDTSGQTHKVFLTTQKAAAQLFCDTVALLTRDGWQQFFYTAKNVAGDRIWGARGVTDGATVYVSEEKYSAADFPVIAGGKARAARLILSDPENWTAGWRQWAEYWADHSDDDERPLGGQL
jgi:hypothetical protein